MLTFPSLKSGWRSVLLISESSSIARLNSTCLPNINTTPFEFKERFVNATLRKKYSKGWPEQRKGQHCDFQKIT